MKRTTRFIIPFAALLLSACGGGPPAPDWKKDSASLIGKYSKAELKGENKLAERYFEQAQDAAGSTGKLEETAKLNLILCATRQASLNFDPCTAYLTLAKLSPNSENETYHRFITGKWEGMDDSKLPAQYRDFVASRDAAKQLAALQEIKDPLSRLIAVSIAVLRKQADNAALNLAADTASEQGWRKPLLVYLKLLENHASLKNNVSQLEALRARIKLVEDSFQ
jgi:hypothetical protein